MAKKQIVSGSEMREELDTEIQPLKLNSKLNDGIAEKINSDTGLSEKHKPEKKLVPFGKDWFKKKKRLIGNEIDQGLGLQSYNYGVGIPKKEK
jgi:hypothetical protein